MIVSTIVTKLKKNHINTKNYNYSQKTIPKSLKSNVKIF